MSVLIDRFDQIEVDDPNDNFVRPWRSQSHFSKPIIQFGAQRGLPGLLLHSDPTLQSQLLANESSGSDQAGQSEDTVAWISGQPWSRLSPTLPIKLIKRSEDLGPVSILQRLGSHSPGPGEGRALPTHYSVKTQHFFPSST